MDKASAKERLTRIKEVGNLRAAPPGAATKGQDAELVQRQLGPVSSDVQEDLKTLQEAGWTFGTAEVASDNRAFDVVMDADGHLKLAGRALTVKLDPDLETGAVTALLDRMGLKIRRELGFAPNTFLIESEDGSALQAARDLNELPEVLYAEPNLVEAMRSRR